VIDVLRGEDGISWLVSTPSGPEIVDEVDGADEWPLGKLMQVWTLPEEEIVEAHLTQESESSELWESVKQWIKGAVVLPDPQDGWADFLTAWVLGSHLHRRFSYYPMIYLPGEPERGKTRLGKAIIYLAFRGHYSPSLTPATLFRWAEWHKVTLMLDVGSITTVLERGDMLDLILNRFERHGRISRAIHPDKRPSEQVQSFAVYGPTILLTNEQLRRTHANVRSRCIEVSMPEAGHVEVPDAMTPEDAKDLFARIVAWAAGNHTTALPQVEMPFRSRLKDLAKPILQVARLANPKAVQSVIDVLSIQDRERRADNAESWEARVAIALWGCREKVKQNRLFISQLTEEVNKGRDENEKLTPANVGTARRKLGLSGGKGGATGTAYVIWPGDEEVEALYDRYSSPEPPDPPDTVGTQGETGQDTSSDTLQSLQKASRTESLDTTTSTGGSGHTGGSNGAVDKLPTYMSRLDAPGDDGAVGTLFDGHGTAEMGAIQDEPF